VAAEAYARALGLWCELGDPVHEGDALMGQGREHGSGPDAVASYTQAQKIYRPADWGRARRARRKAAS
jgi:hypothetical protein